MIEIMTSDDLTVAQQILKAANLPQNFVRETLKRANLSKDLMDAWKEAKPRTNHTNASSDAKDTG